MNQREETYFIWINPTTGILSFHFEKGFEHGDIVEIAIGEKKWDVPLCTSYSDVDNGEVVLRATGETDGVVLAINMGDFATTAGIAQKSAIEEEPGYRWDYLMESSVEITITMKEEGGYREQWLIRQLVRTNERTDYAHLSDEAFANFRVIETTGMGRGVLYRSSSPINPELGRNTYADKAAENAGMLTVVNLADPSNTYEGTENTYYSTCKVTYVNLGTDFLSEASLSGLADGMRFIINNEGPYLIHCNEGKDRAGFVSALLECLMGATIDEVVDEVLELLIALDATDDQLDSPVVFCSPLTALLPMPFRQSNSVRMILSRNRSNLLSLKRS